MVNEPVKLFGFKHMICVNMSFLWMPPSSGNMRKDANQTPERGRVATFPAS
jgi:hypothetical protein